MKKVETNYEFYSGKDDMYNCIKVIMSEEIKDHMKITFYDERWRSKKEFIELFEGIIKELKKL